MDSDRIPAQQASLISEFGRRLQASVAAEIEAVQDELVGLDERRDAIFKGTRAVFKKVTRAMFSISTGLADGSDVLIADAAAEIDALLGQDKANRDGNLSVAIETLTEATLLRHFFDTGRLCPMSECANVTGEEYLAACLRFATDLSRYAVGRATEGDERSIRICQRLCNELNSKMLEFDFRNGPLRYDLF
jgi:predicted translin family RNA/ssDNA-binding protein